MQSDTIYMNGYPLKFKMEWTMTYESGWLDKYAQSQQLNVNLHSQEKYLRNMTCLYNKGVIMISCIYTLKVVHYIILGHFTMEQDITKGWKSSSFANPRKKCIHTHSYVCTYAENSD